MTCRVARRDSFHVYVIWSALAAWLAVCAFAQTPERDRPTAAPKTVRARDTPATQGEERSGTERQIQLLTERLEALSRQVEAVSTRAAEDAEARRRIADLEARLQRAEERVARAEAANSGLRAELAKVTSGNPSGRLLAGVESGGGTASQSVGARIIPAALTSPVTPTAARPKPQKSEPQEPSPLSLRLGTAYLTPVGFMDFTAVYRSTNVGSEIGTSFGGIPFNNTPAGRLSETRLSARNSRIGLRVDAKVKGALVLGYLESDFLGTNPGNVAVSSNSNGLRMRLYWADVRKDKWELLAGQSWSLLTPNRRGLSPLPGDLFYTQDVDVNYQNGLVWGRIPQFRVVYHPNESAAFGVSLENPEQYIGGSAGGGVVTLPTAYVTPDASQLNSGNTGLAVPNLHPDVIVKAAFDRQLADRNVHFEVAGLAHTVRLYDPIGQRHFMKTGGGASANLNFELVKNLRLVTNNYWSEGGGRYIFGQAPDLIVRGNGSPSLIHSGSTVSGLEWQAGRSLLLYG